MKNKAQGLQNVPVLRSDVDIKQALFLDILKKTQGQNNSSRKKLKQIFQKTQANPSRTQYFANWNHFCSQQKLIIFNSFPLKLVQTEVFLLK